MLIRTAIVPTPTSQTSPPFAKGAGDAHTVAAVMGLMGARMSYARNVEIFGEGEAAEYIYKVVSGAVRSCRVLDDGRRQVTAFHMPGQVFGLEIGEEHRF